MDVCKRNGVKLPYCIHFPSHTDRSVGSAFIQLGPYLTLHKLLFLYFSLPIESLPKLPNSNRTYRQDESSEITSLDMTPKVSTNNYGRTPRAPLITTTNNQKPSKLSAPRVQVKLIFFEINDSFFILIRLNNLHKPQLYHQHQ